MSDLRKAAQALVNQWESNTAYPFGSLVDALRAALAQPEQEPLTEEEMREVLKEFFFTPNLVFGDVVRAIEKAHGIGSDT